MIANALESPFVVPLGLFAMVLGIVAVARFTELRKRQMESMERMAEIAKGIPPGPLSADPQAMSQAPAAWRAADAMRRTSNIRRGGIVLVSLGIGTALFFMLLSWILQTREVLSGAATSIIPFAIGAGLLIDVRMENRQVAALAEGSADRTGLGLRDSA